MPTSFSKLITNLILIRKTTFSALTLKLCKACLLNFAEQVSKAEIVCWCAWSYLMKSQWKIVQNMYRPAHWTIFWKVGTPINFSISRNTYLVTLQRIVSLKWKGNVFIVQKNIQSYYYALFYAFNHFPSFSQSFTYLFRWVLYFSQYFAIFGKLYQISMRPSSESILRINTKQMWLWFQPIVLYNQVTLMK